MAYATASSPSIDIMVLEALAQRLQIDQQGAGASTGPTSASNATRSY
jgi:hypothetical protein